MKGLYAPRNRAHSEADTLSHNITISTHAPKVPAEKKRYVACSKAAPLATLLGVRRTAGGTRRTAKRPAS